MKFIIKNQKIQILLFSLACTIIIFSLSHNSSKTLQKLSFNFRYLNESVDVEGRCEKAEKNFLDKYKNDYHSNINFDELDKYQKVLRSMIEEKDYKEINKYLPRILMYFIFLIVDIVLIIVWFIYCGCCCCSSKNRSSSSICGKCSFILFLLLSCIVILLCVFGYFQTSCFYKSINGIACAFYKLVFHFIEGTKDDFSSKWKGVEGLKDLIEEYGTTYDNITTLNENEDFGQECEGENTYCPIYKEVVGKLKEETKDTEFINSLKDSEEQLDSISSTFTSFKDNELDEVEKIMEKLDKFCKLGLIILFSAIFLFCFLGLLTQILYFTCNCECVKCLYHLFWNFEMLIILVTLLVGVCFGIVGVLSKDAISLLQYTISQENLDVNKNNTFLLNIDEDNKEKINKCFNDNGELYNDIFKSSSKYNSNVDEYYAEFEKNYNDFKNSEDYSKKTNLAKKYEELHQIMKSMKNLSDNLKEDNLKEILNCKFIGMDFNILIDEIKESLVKKLVLFSLIIIIADLAGAISIFFGISVLNNYKGQSRAEEAETHTKHSKSRNKETKNNMDSSSDNLRK